MTIDIGQLANDALGVAKALLPLVVPGAGGEIIAAANSAISLVQNVKQDFADPQKVEAEETLAALQERVDAHVKATEAALGG